MELIARIRHRVGYVWYWRARHWWMDKPSARIARASGAVMLLLAVVAQVVHYAAVSALPQPAGQPHQAIFWVVAYLIIALVVAVLLAVTAKKPKAPDPAQAQGPTTQDGQNVKHHFGTVRETDTFLLAWRIIGRDPIKRSGGK